jgi:hypothetical protein
LEVNYALAPAWLRACRGVVVRTPASDDDEERRLTVLLVDGSGSGGVGLTNGISW